MFREIELIRSPAVNARHENAMISRRRSNCRFGRIPTPAEEEHEQHDDVRRDDLHHERPVARPEQRNGDAERSTGDRGGDVDGRDRPEAHVA